MQETNTPEGLLESAVSGGMCYSYAYDVMGRLTEKKASGRTLLSFRYDPNGNLTHHMVVTKQNGLKTGWCG